MKCLEIIELRSVKNDKTLLELDIHSIFEDEQGVKLQEIKVYKHSKLETDWSIHLHYDSEKNGIEMSPLGLRLAEALKEYGLVNHSMWIEKRSSN